VRKRKLYKQVLGSEVEWFPHEMDIDLVKELVWEAGSPRWVLLGTPASGAAIHGSFEMGCSVVALCADQHHLTHLFPAVVVRAVEAMASQSSVIFKDDVLHLRSLELNLGKPASAPKKEPKKKLPVADEDVDEDSEASASADDDAPKKKKGKPSPKPPKQKKKVASCSSSSSSSSDSQETHKKKGKKLRGH
jgi:hypothetical protein